MVDQAVQDYVDGIAAEYRPLFDRVHSLILEVEPEATVSLSYRMPTYRVGSHRIHVGAWKHGLSIYGWRSGEANAFTALHPELRTSRGTIQLRPEDAAAISDDELKGLLRIALNG